MYLFCFVPHLCKTFALNPLAGTANQEPNN